MEVDQESGIVSKPQPERIRKSHMCIFCKDKAKKFFTNLKLHLERFHSEEPEVIEMKIESKKHPGSRAPMAKLLYLGDHEYNTNSDLNKGDYLCKRESKRKRRPDELTTCKFCLASIGTANFRKHYSRCTNKIYPHTIGLALIGGLDHNKWHSRASEKLRAHLNILKTFYILHFKVAVIMFPSFELVNFVAICEYQIFLSTI